MNAQKTGQPLPAVGDEFELTTPSINPLLMLSDDGFNPEAWSFMGSHVIPGTRVFKLVRVGAANDLSFVRTMLTQHGSIPGGEWRVAFAKKYPKMGGNGSIGIADPSWVRMIDHPYFPSLHELNHHWWYSSFDSARAALNQYWRWLVAVK